MKENLIVIEPVIDLLKEPYKGKREEKYDRLRDTQVLYNESLILKEEKGDFLFVEAEEQKKFYEGWKGYEGWVRKKSVTKKKARLKEGIIKEEKTVVFSEKGTPLLFLLFGTKINILEEEPLFFRIELLDGKKGFVKKEHVRRLTKRENKIGRHEIVEKASIFFNTFYLWGGRSLSISEIRETKTGVDCSGFINLLFRVFGIDLPRDARDQWLFSKAISFCQLKEGDLLFLTEEESEIIGHVMLYAGNGRAIEARGRGLRVERVNIKERLGIDIAYIEEPQIFYGKRLIYARRVIEDED